MQNRKTWFLDLRGSLRARLWAELVLIRLWLHNYGELLSQVWLAFSYWTDRYSQIGFAALDESFLVRELLPSLAFGHR